MTRLPRFKRSPEIPVFQLTDRDREILRHVHRHRFLRTDHLAALTTGSSQQMLRRLQRLYHHGFLERPRCQIDHYQSGSRRMAYGLGNKGAAWLKRECSLPYHKLDWKRKNHVGRLFLEHALLVSDIMVAVELACRNRKNVRLLMVDDLNIPKIREPFQWKVNIGIKCGVIPDRVFGLEFNGQRCWYFLEADRATMPVTRGNLSQTSFFRKLLAYEATWTQNIHRRNFDIHRFRVLTVTTNSERVQSMIAVALQKRNDGHFVVGQRRTFERAFDFAADIRFIALDRARKFVGKSRVFQSKPDSVRHEKCRAIAAKFQVALQLQRANSFFGTANQIPSNQPFSERDFAGLEYRADGDGKLLLAIRAPAQTRADFLFVIGRYCRKLGLVGAFAMRAKNAVFPADAFKMLACRVICRKLVNYLYQRQVFGLFRFHGLNIAETQLFVKCIIPHFCFFSLMDSTGR